MRSTKKVALGVAAVVLTATVSGGIALGQGASMASGDASVVERASADQLAAFSVLGSPRTESDEISLRSVDEIDQRLRDIASANVGLSQRIGKEDDLVRAWLVPGDGQVCIVTDETGRAAFQCVATTVAASGDAVQTRSGGPGSKSGTATVAQLLPDGVKRVTITAGPTSTTSDVAVEQNWMLATVTNPSAVAFNEAGRRRTKSLGHLPG